jgi:hypothetical protein
MKSGKPKMNRENNDTMVSYNLLNCDPMKVSAKPTDKNIMNIPGHRTMTYNEQEFFFFELTPIYHGTLKCVAQLKPKQREFHTHYRRQHQHTTRRNTWLVFEAIHN